MARGLYKTIFDKHGIYNASFRRGGSQQPIKSTDQRLGQADEDEDEDTPAPTAKSSFFSREVEGFPMWVVGIFLLGFAWAYRRRKKEQK